MTLPSTPALLAIVTLGAFGVAMFVRALRQTLALRRLGVGTSREYDMERIASYATTVGVRGSGALMPERAWVDLDMDDVYRALDRTVSWPGRHLLYARLRREDHDFAELRRFDEAVTRVAESEALLKRVRSALEPLESPRAGTLPALFLAPPAPAPAVVRALPLLSVAGIFCLVAAFRWPPLILAVVLVVVVNAYVRVVMRPRIEALIPGMRTLPAMLRSATRLAAIDAPALAPQVEALRTAIPRLQWLARAARWLSFEPGGGNELAGYLYEYLNMVFLLDVTSYAWSIGAVRAEREILRATYEAIGAVDVIQSVATLRREARPWSRPVFIAGVERRLAFDELTHPLLDEPVASSLELVGQGLLLTGSNMSGKSTFLRAVGVNAILARTIHTTFARRWQAPLLAVRTSIGRADSLLAGRSYYQAEVEAVGALLAPSETGQRLILIDELFRGTNSIERIAAARAVLAHLEAGEDIVLVATHDVELIPLLPGYALHHFREEIREGALTFDYRLHAGPSSTRNALAILALAGYPAEVVADAERTAEMMEGRVRERGTSKE